MAAVSESRVSYLDDFWFYAPSQHSDNEEHSDHDSDYETDNEDVALKFVENIVNVQWTGYAKRIPVMLFSVDAVFRKKANYKTVAEQYSLTFKFASTDCKIVRNILSSHGFIEAKPGSTEFNLLWSNAHLKPSTLRLMAEFQKINHFPRSYELTRKDRLFRNIQRMQLMKGHKNFDFIPASYVLPGDYQEFYSQFLKTKGLYIVKPVASSQGRGVFVVSHPDQVPLDENVIVSKYISAPLVIDGFKFDVRCYVAVTSYDPLVIYLYEEGLTRFATIKYEKDMKFLRNQCMHLTNYSVNKRSQYYVKNADPDVENFGNKWSMSAMLRHLRAVGKDTAALMMQIENIVIKTILSAESSIVAACKMYQPYRGNCFELYGFDILIDENLKPWVLEVNFSPSLTCDTPLDLKVKSNMLCDLLSLIGVVCQDPSSKRRLQASRKKKIMDRTTGILATSRLPVRTASEEQDKNTHMTGLNSEEIKILRSVKEEEARKGGWIRIFPSADSWETYGHLLHFPNAHNVMLHQRLYPDRSKGTSSGKTASSITARQSMSKSKTQLPIRNIKVGLEKDVEISSSGLTRARQYERKLKQLNISSHDDTAKSKLQLNISSHDDTAKNLATAKTVAGNFEAEDSADCECEDVSVSDKRGDVKLKKSTTLVKDKLPGKSETKAVSVKSPSSSSTVSRNGSVDDSAAKSIVTVREPVATGEPHQVSHHYTAISKADILTLFQNGYRLSTIQARTAFSMYLVRVQERLLSDWSNTVLQRGLAAANKQIELVLRFLKCAAANLPQTFQNVVPSKKLPMQNRNKLLAEQLGIFIGLYSKETEDMKARKIRMRSERGKQKRSESCGALSDHDFAEFVSTAKEDELEAVLMAYAKSSKSPTIFLGGDTELEIGTELEDTNQQQYSCHSDKPLSHDPVTFGAMGDSAETKEDNQSERAMEDAIQHLSAKLQLLKCSSSDISSQKPRTEHIIEPHCGYPPSSTTDMSSAKSPEKRRVTFECQDLNLLLNKTHRTANTITSKHNFTLVGKSMKPLTSRKQTKRRAPETKPISTT
ncbi:hypothetical protein BsWGS_14638 [Bradybaena similaris]